MPFLGRLSGNETALVVALVEDRDRRAQLAHVERLDFRGAGGDGDGLTIHVAQPIGGAAAHDGAVESRPAGFLFTGLVVGWARWQTVTAVPREIDRRRDGRAARQVDPRRQVAVPHPHVAGGGVDPRPVLVGGHLQGRARRQALVDVAGQEHGVGDRHIGIGGADPRLEVDGVDVDRSVRRDPRGSVDGLELGAVGHDGARAVLGLGKQRGRQRLDVVGGQVVPTGGTAVSSEHPGATRRRHPCVTHAGLRWRAHGFGGGHRGSAVLGLRKLRGAQGFHVLGVEVVPTGTFVAVVVEAPPATVRVGVIVAESGLGRRTLHRVGAVLAEQFEGREVHVLTVDVGPPGGTGVHPLGAVLVDVTGPLDLVGAIVRGALPGLVAVTRHTGKVGGAHLHEDSLVDARPVGTLGGLAAPCPDVTVRIGPRRTEHLDGTRLLHHVGSSALLGVSRYVGECVHQRRIGVVDVHPLSGGRDIAPRDSLGRHVIAPLAGDRQLGTHRLGFGRGDAGNRGVRGFGGGGLVGRRREKRVATGATSSRNSLIVDQQRGAGSDDRVVAVGRTVLEAVHAHVDVLGDEHRSQRSQVLGQVLEVDALDLGPRASAILVVREELDHLLDVADVGAGTAVGATAVQTGSRGIDRSGKCLVLLGDLVGGQIERRSEGVRSDHSGRLEKGSGRTGDRGLVGRLLAPTARRRDHEHSGHQGRADSLEHGSSSVTETSPHTAVIGMLRSFRGEHYGFPPASLTFVVQGSFHGGQEFMATPASHFFKNR